MAPRAKITREMIIEEAFRIAQEKGIEKVTARSISERLHCSTQPVLYYFSTVEEIKGEVYRKADRYHSAYLTSMERDYGNPMLTIGMNYIRFAMEERNLFRFLFQSDEFTGKGLSDLMDSDELLPVLDVLRKELNSSKEEAKEVFGTLAVFVHGYASLFANNAMICEEAKLIDALNKVFCGAVSVLKEKRSREGFSEGG